MRLELNFASREYVILRKLYAALLAGLLAAAALFVAMQYMHGRDVDSLEELKTQVKLQEAALGESTKKLGEFARSMDKKTLSATYTEAAFANAAISRRTFSWTLFLNRMEELVPDGVGITNIRPDFKTLDVDMAGTAKDIESLTTFLVRLTGSEYFSDIPPSFKTSEEKLGPDIGKVVQKFNFKLRYIPHPGEPEAAGTDVEGG